MKTIRATLAVVAITAAAPALAQAIAGAPNKAATDTAADPAKLSVARDIVAVILPPDQRDKMMNAVLNAMMGNMMSGTLRGLGIEDKVASDPAIRSVFEAFVQRQKDLALEDIHVALPGLVEAYAHAYARMFSLDDLREIRTFVQTPAGSRFMQRSASLLSDPDVANWQRTLAAKGAARQQVELQRFKSQLEAAGLKVPRAT